MSTMYAVVLGLSFWLQAEDTPLPAAADAARLRELLQDRQHPRNQSQAALLLVQQATPEARAIVRQGLRQTEVPEVFLALAAALRLCRAGGYTDDLLVALASDRPAVRQSAAETLAALGDAQVVLRLQAVAEDTHADLPTRQAALFALGRCTRRGAAVVLLDQLSSDNPVLRQAAADALGDLTGQAFGLDVDGWRSWWTHRKELSEEQWLKERLAYQATRADRLAADLDRSKAQVIRLHQQLYARLPVAERLGYVQALVEQEDAAVRVLAANWAVELLPAADAVGQLALAETLLRLSRDGTVEVQRPATLALGRVNEARALDRLRSLLLRPGPAPVRAAAARALAQHARGPGPEATVRQREIVPLLQKALEDPALEVVVEAAEDLGALGVPEAGPVLTALLRHPSEPVRQTAAQALERVADATILDGLLQALDDPAVTVRFSLVGALGHAAGDAHALTPTQRETLVARLEGLLRRDTDPGVRSRAATVLGECGPTAVLPSLWQRVRSGEDARVQEKAWAALVEIILRSGSPELLAEWDRTLAEAKQGPRRLQLLGEAASRWQKREETRAAAGTALEALVPAQLDEGKWAAAFPVVRELLARPGSEAELGQRLRWLLTIGEQALKEGNRGEALRAVQEARAFLPRAAALAADFDKLAQRAGPAP